MPVEKGALLDNRIIYTPSQFAKSNLIHLQETGTIKAKEPHTNSRENLNSYLFFIVISGSGVFTYNKITYHIKTGDCVFIDCRIPYSHRSSDDLWELKWAHFYGPNMKGIYNKYLERGGLPTFTSKNIKEYNNTLTKIFEIASGSNYIRDMQLFEQITSLLTLIMSESHRNEKIQRKNNVNINLQEVKEFIDNNFYKKITLDGLAENFYINKFYLTRVFKDQFGISPIDYLLHVRITHAKTLLRFSELSIEKVGIECGIPDTNYFTRIFKKIEGYPPGEYRKRW